MDSRQQLDVKHIDRDALVANMQRHKNTRAASTTKQLPMSNINNGQRKAEPPYRKNYDTTPMLVHVRTSFKRAGMEFKLYDILV